MADKPKFTNDGYDAITRDGGPTLRLVGDEQPVTKANLEKITAALNYAAANGKL